MGAALSLLLWACLANATTPVPHHSDGRPALPDTATFRAEISAFNDLSAATRAHQAGVAKALELEPDSLEGWYNLGILAYREGMHDEALRCFEKAWSLQPGEERVQQMLQTVATARRVTARSATD